MLYSLLILIIILLSFISYSLYQIKEKLNINLYLSGVEIPSHQEMPVLPDSSKTSTVDTDVEIITVNEELETERKLMFR